MKKPSENFEIMTERDIARAMAKRTGDTIKNCAVYARAFLDSFAEFVEEKKDVRLFGYIIVDHIEREARYNTDFHNPGNKIYVPPRSIPRIRLAGHLQKSGVVLHGEAADSNNGD